MANILVIDDDELLCKMLITYIKSLGHDVSYELTLNDGLRHVAYQPVDIVFLDVMLPDGNGLDELGIIKSSPSSPEVIIITSEGDPGGVEMAIKSGAWDYIEKPLSVKDLMLPLHRALQYRSEKSRAGKYRKPVNVSGIVGGSPQLQSCIELLSQAAGSDANVFITGETGTGKELFATAIHENSLRKDGNLVVVDCASLPETLVEGMLFGHEKGAYTGAVTSRVGLVKQADGGTLFLDEVGELPLQVQKAFIRVLQERRFRPLGGRKEISSDFRLIAATNRDLDHMVKTGRYREDLLFRLKALSIEIPPLRNRPQDIKEITNHYLEKFRYEYEGGKKDVSSDFYEALYQHNWPGNVRELIHAIESAIAAARFEKTLFSRHLPMTIRIPLAQKALTLKKKDPGESALVQDSPKNLAKLQEIRDEAVRKIEKAYLKDLMVATEGDIASACRVSGLSRSRLYHLLQKYREDRNGSL